MSYSIAEAATATDLTPDTLRYYERDGLMLAPVTRSATGHRRYSESDLTWLQLLTCLRGTGMPIREVRRYAELVRDGAGNELARLELLRAHRARVLAQLAEVQEHLGAIDRKIGIYTEKVGPALERGALERGALESGALERGALEPGALDLERTPSA